MSTEPRPAQARRVVTGLDGEGRSTIISDGEISTWVRRPTGTVVMDIWRAESLPTRTEDAPVEGGEPVLALDPTAVAVRLAVFPPDDEVDAASAAAYEAAMLQIYGEQGGGPSAAVAGMHRTDTVDVVTVVEGEIWVVLENGETLLRAGDCLVQRGTRHAWQNRSDRPCVLATTMLPLTRI